MSEGHLGQETLVWHYYGDDEDAGQTARHLGACAACRGELERLKATLRAVEAWPVPERDAGYGERVWRDLVRRDRSMAARLPWWRRGLLPVRRLALAGSLGVLVLGAFLLGRASRAPKPLPEVVSSPAAVRERILAAALSEHLAQSERILLEILNRAGEQQGQWLDIADEQLRAAGLLDDNRLYRQTATRQGQLALANVLEDLERVLLDVARGPHDLSSEQVAILRARVDDQGLVFKVRVLEARLREQDSRPLAQPGGRASKG